MSHDTRFKLLIVASSMAALGCAASYAQEQSKTSEGIAYVSGGVGDDSETRLSSMARDYNLKLVFTLNEGNYLADVGVTITDARGKKVIDDISSGPFFLAKLAAGHYTVMASYEGKTQTRKISVGKSTQVAYLRWPSNPADDFPGPRDEPAGAGKTASRS